MLRQMRGTQLLLVLLLVANSLAQPPAPAAQPQPKPKPRPPPAPAPPQQEDCPAEAILAFLRQQQQQQPSVSFQWPSALKQGLTCTMELSQLSVALPGSRTVCTVLSIQNNLLSILYSWQLAWSQSPSSKAALSATRATGAMLLNGTAGGDSNTIVLINTMQSPNIPAQGGSADMLVQLAITPPPPAAAGPVPPSVPPPPEGAPASSPAPAAAPKRGGSSIKPAVESVYLNGLQCTRLPLVKPAAAAAGGAAAGGMVTPLLALDDCGTAEWPLGDDGTLLLSRAAAAALGQDDDDGGSSSVPTTTWEGVNATSSRNSSASVNVTTVLAALRQLSCVSQLCCGLQVVPTSVVSVNSSSGDAANSTEPPVVATGGPASVRSTDSNNASQVDNTQALPADITPEPVAQSSANQADARNATALVIGLVVAGAAVGCLGALLVVLLRHKRRKRQLLAAHLKQQAQTQQGLVRHGSGASSNGSGGAASLASLASAEWQQQQQHYAAATSRPPLPWPRGAGPPYALPTHRTAPPQFLTAAAATAAAELSAAAGVWRASSWQGPDAYTAGAGAGPLEGSASGPQPLMRTATASTGNTQLSSQQAPAFGASLAALQLPPTGPALSHSGVGVAAGGSPARQQHASANSSPRDMLSGAGDHSSFNSTWGSLRRYLSKASAMPAVPRSSTLASRTSSSTLGLERQGSQPTAGCDTGHQDTLRSLPHATTAAAAAGPGAGFGAGAVMTRGQQWEQAAPSLAGLYRPPLQLIQEAAPLSAAAAALHPHSISQQQLHMLASAGTAAVHAGLVSSGPAATGASEGGAAGTVSRRISPVLSVSEDASSAASTDSITPAAWHLTDRQLLEGTPGWLNIDFVSEVRLEKKLGEGGFGQVFRARWRGEVIAAKLVPFMSLVAQHHQHLPSVSLVSAAAGTPEAAAAAAVAAPGVPQAAADAGQLSNMRLGVQFSSASLRAIKVEIRVLSQLSHPRIVAFKGACLAPPHICILEELAEGGSLHGRLYSRSSASKAAQQQRQRHLQQQQQQASAAASASGSSKSSSLPQPRPRKAGPSGSGSGGSSRGSVPPLSVREVLHIAQDVTEAMCYLHALQPQVVHRDLKPQNVLLDLQGRAKIADFGISKMKDVSLAASSTRLQMGTPAYMAPEQFEGCSVTDKVDVFAFGVLLWECFEQQQPWRELSPMQIIYSVGLQKERLPRPARCPDQLWQLIEQCWAQDPLLRPSFADVQRALQQMQQELELADGASGSSSSSQQPVGDADGEVDAHVAVVC